MDRKSSLKLPKKVTILGKEFKFIPKTSEQLEEYADKDETIAAIIVFSDMEILYDRSASTSEVLLSLFHETSHVAQMVSGLDQVIDKKLQEVIAESHSHAYTDLIKSLQ
jgi:hypothetical protein